MAPEFNPGKSTRRDLAASGIKRDLERDQPGIRANAASMRLSAPPCPAR
jgi:hypothetical protein